MIEWQSTEKPRTSSGLKRFIKVSNSTLQRLLRTLESAPWLKRFLTLCGENLGVRLNEAEDDPFSLNLEIFVSTRIGPIFVSSMLWMCYKNVSCSIIQTVSSSRPFPENQILLR